MRVKRGTLKSTKVGGNVYVLLEANELRPNIPPDTNRTSELTTDQTRDRTELIAALQAQVKFLQEELRHREEVHGEENRRRDSIIAALTQRIPELEAASEPRESVVSSSEDPQKGVVPQESAAGEIGRSWWQRLFGG